MDAEGFFARWARRKEQTDPNRKQHEAPSSEEPTPAPELKPAGDEPLAKPEAEPPPTLDDVARLTPESDYSRFVARGVGDNVKRSALKKLFSDPHYNLMDGLDTYIEDFNKFKPIPAALLARLRHAKALLDPLAHLDKLPSTLVDKLPESVAATEAAETDRGAVAEAAAAGAIPEAEPAPPDSVSSDGEGQAGAEPETGKSA